MSAWSEEDFQQRCHRRAAELGQPLRKLLDREGLGHDTMDVQTSRRVTTLEKIARALHWSLAEVMGFSVLGRISPDLLEIAFNTAQEALLTHLPPGDPSSSRRVIRTAARVYNVLHAAQSDGSPIDAAMLAAIRRTIVEVWGAEDAGGPAAVVPNLDPDKRGAG